MFYQYNCTSPNSIIDLEYIIDNAEVIDLSEFTELVDIDDFNNLVEALGYTSDFTINDDWHVTYHKGKLKNGKKYAYLQHSSIEYVFY